MTADEFESQLAMLLKDQPRGTAADFADCMTAYWNGSQVVFAFLCEHGTGRIDEEFDLDDYVWEEWEPAFAAWLVSPLFSARTELLEWARKGGS